MRTVGARTTTVPSPDADVSSGSAASRLAGRAFRERRIWRVLVAYPSVTFIWLQAVEFFINNYGVDQRLLQRHHPIAPLPVLGVAGAGADVDQRGRATQLFAGRALRLAIIIEMTGAGIADIECAPAQAREMDGALHQGGQRCNTGRVELVKA